MANVKMDGHTITQLKLIGSDDSTVTKQVTAELNLQNKTVTPTTSQQVITADEGYDGLDEVTVSAASSEGIIPTGTLSVTENGTYDVTAYASASVNVAASGGDSESYATGTLTYTGAEATFRINWNLPFTPRVVKIKKTDAIDYTVNGCVGFSFIDFGDSAFDSNVSGGHKWASQAVLETRSTWGTYASFIITTIQDTTVTPTRGSVIPRSALHPWQPGTYEWEAWG